ncbi:hypothetical protein [Streptomyces sp. NBC_01320]|uniref:hypothetical protein n=1 Tax=Streptomyces sp. NBC_01320 TaxID=2903824 RepID=UPI002E1525C7|nr:hypothetical protein OG395_44240 [Streptomyces sp. NBC_01320]
MLWRVRPLFDDWSSSLAERPREGAGRIRSLGVDWGGRPLNPHPELLMLGPDVVYYPELVLSADMEVFLDLTGMAN